MSQVIIENQVEGNLIFSVYISRGHTCLVNAVYDSKKWVKEMTSCNYRSLT